jgi:glucose/arabinose dehydrogenase
MKSFLVFFLFFLSYSSFGETSPQYRVNNVPAPPTKFKNYQIDGLTFLPNGKLVVCLPSGEIFFRDIQEESWELFAEGLHNPLGVIALTNSELIVTQRPELTRIRDLDGDGKADDFEVITDDFGMSGNYHEFNFTPVRDQDGNYFFALGTGSRGDGVRTITRGTFNKRGRPGRMHSSAPYRGCIMKLTTEGKTIPWSYGHRTPNGLGFDLKGNLFVTDNQGDWVGSSKLFHVQKDNFYGHAASLAWKKGFEGVPLDTPVEKLAKMRSRACVVFPHGTMANSPTKVLAITPQAKMGPFSGQLLVGEMNRPRIMRVMLEEVGGELQGACVPFIDGSPLGRGCNRMDWAPDGSLYVGQTKHTWAGGEGIQRVSWDGKTPFEIQNMQLQEKGFKFTFTKPVNRELASKKETWSFSRYYYEYREAYGSPRSDEAKVEISAIHISKDAKTVEVDLTELKAWHIHEVTIQNLFSSSEDKLSNNYIVYTLNRLIKDTPPEPLQIKRVSKSSNSKKS